MQLANALCRLVEVAAEVLTLTDPAPRAAMPSGRLPSVISAASVSDRVRAPAGACRSRRIARPQACRCVVRAESPFAPTGPTEECGRVVRITDGDTIRVVIDGVEHRLRYIGIDTPESVAPDTPVEPYAEQRRLPTPSCRTARKSSSSVMSRRPTASTACCATSGWRPTSRTRRPTTILAPRQPASSSARASPRPSDYPPDVKYSAILEAAESDARAAGRGMWAEELIRAQRVPGRARKRVARGAPSTRRSHRFGRRTGRSGARKRPTSSVSS